MDSATGQGLWARQPGTGSGLWATATGNGLWATATGNGLWATATGNGNPEAALLKHEGALLNMKELPLSLWG